MSLSQNDRFTDAEELKAALIGAHRSVRVAPPTPPPQPALPANVAPTAVIATPARASMSTFRVWWGLALVGIVLAGVIGLVGFANNRGSLAPLATPQPAEAPEGSAIPAPNQTNTTIQTEAATTQAQATAMQAAVTAQTALAPTRETLATAAAQAHAATAEAATAQIRHYRKVFIS